MNVNNGSFTPLVFSIHELLYGRECKTFYSRLATLITDERKTPSSITSSWIRTKVCFALLKSSLLCFHWRLHIISATTSATILF